MELSSVKGVGAKTAEKLAAAGLVTARDLINFLPRTYEDFSRVVKIADLKPGKVTIRAHCESVSTRIVRRGMRITTAVLADDSDRCQAVWFNQPYRETQLKSGAEFFFSGEFGFHAGRYQLTTPSAEAVKDMPVQAGRILPIYPARGGLKPNVTRKILSELRPLITMADETLPTEIVSNEKLPSRADALLGLHFPDSAEQADAARNRLAFEELFGLILAARLNKQENSKLEGPKIPFDQPRIKKFVDDLPFTLTGAQKRALWEILQNFAGSFLAKGDSAKVTPMNRLLQGDVGSGKTVVAGVATYQAALVGYQTAFMAPTEILATQHAETLTKLLHPHEINVALLTGSVKGKNRANLLKQIKNGRAQVVVGTHALFQKSVDFKRLGFVVIDEQHRFGVKQRQELLAKAGGDDPSSDPSLSKTSYAGRPAEPPLRANLSASSGIYVFDCEGVESSEKPSLPAFTMPHLLSMTATPIPRSLQLTLFGDLDISILNELPKGRRPIITEIVSPNSRAGMNEKILQKLSRGQQIYIIAPLIEETLARNDPAKLRNDPAKLAKNSVENLAKEAQRTFKNYKIGVLHGRQPAAEKEKTMREFAAHETQILVATTVVEVGVDVPNATVMVIENADQFGLAQLHQLRGRVGRGEHQSHCFLVQSDSNPPTRRLREIERSVDGFYLAEVDLKLRGAGEIYGTAQHGELNLQIANLADTRLIKRASVAADWFIDSGKNLLQYKELAREVNKYQRLTTLN